MIENWQNLIQKIIDNSLPGFLSFFWSLILAVIVFVVGWLIAVVVGKLIAEILNRLKFNNLFGGSGWKEALERADMKVNPSDFIGAIFKWILVVVSLLFAVEILGPRFSQFAGFLIDVLNWLPNLIVAAAIFVVSIVVADIMEKIVKAWVRKMGVGYVDLLGAVVRWAIYIFAGLAILDQLQVSPTLINSLIVGVVAMISLAFGLAFGLGGKEEAGRLIEDARKKISQR